MRHVVGDVLYAVVLVWLLLLIARMVLGWVLFGFGVRPRGALAAFAEITWSSTDPVLRPLDRWLPIYRFGSVAISTGFFVALVSAYVLLDVVRAL